VNKPQAATATAFPPCQATAPGLRLRRAQPADVDAIFALKRRLRISPAAGPSPRGGFLLGVSLARYAELIAHANVLVLEGAGAVGERALLGFSVTLPDRVLRHSPLWARRDAIVWSAAAPAFADDAPVGYFDQIACAPGSAGRLGAPALALCALLDLLSTGHQHVFATVVRAPVHNLAALRMLAAVGARRVGQLREDYEELPDVCSDVYHLDCSASSPVKPWNDTRLGRRVIRMISRWTGAGDR